MTSSVLGKETAYFRSQFPQPITEGKSRQELKQLVTADPQSRAQRQKHRTEEVASETEEAGQKQKPPSVSFYVDSIRKYSPDFRVGLPTSKDPKTKIPCRYVQLLGF